MFYVSIEHVLKLLPHKAMEHEIWHKLGQKCHEARRTYTAKQLGAKAAARKQRMDTVSSYNIGTKSSKKKRCKHCHKSSRRDREPSAEEVEPAEDFNSSWANFWVETAQKCICIHDFLFIYSCLCLFWLLTVKCYERLPLLCLARYVQYRWEMLVIGQLKPGSTSYACTLHSGTTLHYTE